MDNGKCKLKHKKGIKLMNKTSALDKYILKVTKPTPHSALLKNASIRREQVVRKDGHLFFSTNTHRSTGFPHFQLISSDVTNVSNECLFVNFLSF